MPSRGKRVWHLQYCPASFNAGSGAPLALEKVLKGLGHARRQVDKARSGFRLAGRDEAGYRFGTRGLYRTLRISA